MSHRLPTTLIASLLTLSGLACEKESDGQKSDDGAAAVVLKRQGPVELAPKLSQVPSFSFTNQAGEPFGSKELAGKPYLANFMFTRCPTVCPRVTGNMKDVHAAVKKAGLELQLLSISVDPETDTPETLRAYATKHGADRRGWDFLTGDQEAIVKTAEEGFKVAASGMADESKAHFGIKHGSHLVLVDQAGSIRGYFPSGDDSTPQDVTKALSVILKE